MVLDLETTGRAPGSDGIIEIGAVRVVGGAIRDRFTSLVNPGQPIPPFITRLTGIGEAEVQGAPRLGEVLPRFLAFVGESVLVAHNASFDLGFLDREARSLLGRPLDLPALCTLRLARRILPGLRRRSLDALGMHLGIPCRDRHRALGDALIAARILLAFLEMAATAGVRRVGELLELQHPGARGRQRSSCVSRERLAAVPPGPGVYRVLGEGGRALFVGRAGDLRDAVRSRLGGGAAGAQRPPDWIRYARDVAWTECGSVLEAALLEARLLRELKPPYNYPGRHLPRVAFVKLTVSSPYPRLLVSRRLATDRALYLGPFAGYRAAERVRAALARLSGLRTCAARLIDRPGASPCPGGQGDACGAPCAARVTSAVYREQVERVRAFLEGRNGSLLAGEGRWREVLASGACLDDVASLDRDACVVEELARSAGGCGAILTRRNFLVLLRRARGGGALVLAVLGGRLVLEQAVTTAADIIAIAALVRERFAAYQRLGLGREELDAATIVAAWLCGREATEGIVLALPDAGAVGERLDELTVTIGALPGIPGELPEIEALAARRAASREPA